MMTNYGPEVVGDVTWFEILLRCDLKTIGRMIQVSSSLKAIMSNDNFWVEKCQIDGKSLPPIEWRKFVKNYKSESLESDEHQFDYKQIYLKDPYCRNLAPIIGPNTTIEDLKAHPNVRIKNRGYKMLIQRGSDLDFRNPPDIHIDGCLTTTYGWCHRMVLINFDEFGVPNWVMDRIRPNIIIRELCCCRGGSGITYILDTELLRADQTRPSLYDESDDGCSMITYKTWGHGEGVEVWDTVEHKLTNYPAGIRRLFLRSSGSSDMTSFGWCGSKFANLEIIIQFPEEVRFTTNHVLQDPSLEYEYSDSDDDPPWI